MTNQNHWQALRYRGDLNDMEELQREYRVEDFLEAYEERQKLHENSLRQRFLRDGIQLNQRLSPRIYKIVEELSLVLGVASKAEIYSFDSREINAFAYLDVCEEATNTLIGVTSESLEKLDDSELKFIIGHELGHFLFNNHRYNALLREDKSSSVTVLPSLGEMLFLRWRKKQEISADRVGLLASQNFDASAKALMKCRFGLSEKNLLLDIDALMQQIDEIKGKPDIIKAEFASHPLLPIRLKALELFAKSQKAKEYGFPCSGTLLPDQELEDQIDDLLRITKRYPYSKIGEAVMRAVASAGILILGADGDADKEEVKIVMQILYEWFTDEPEKEIETEFEVIKSKLDAAIDLINKEGDFDDKTFVLSRLADIAMADGALIDVEGGLILGIASKMNVPEKAAYSIIIGAAHAGRLQVDTKLNRISESIRQSLISGLKMR